MNYCARPSIIVGRNDSSVAISYFVKVTSDSGFIRIAYQNAPGAPWKFISYVAENFADSSSDLSQVTPVVTPSSDKSYIVLAGYNTNHLPPFELRAFHYPMIVAENAIGITTLRRQRPRRINSFAIIQKR